MLVKDVEKLFKDEESIPSSIGSKEMAVNMCLVQGALVVRVMMAGVVSSSIEISVDNNTLVVMGKRAEDPSYQDAKYYRKEIVEGTIKKTITLPLQVRRDQVRAEFSNGMLTILLPEQQGVTKLAVRQTAGMA